MDIGTHPEFVSEIIPHDGHQNGIWRSEVTIDMFMCTTLPLMDLKLGH